MICCVYMAIFDVNGQMARLESKRKYTSVKLCWKKRRRQGCVQSKINSRDLTNSTRKKPVFA